MKVSKVQNIFGVSSELPKEFINPSKDNNPNKSKTSDDTFNNMFNNELIKLQNNSTKRSVTNGTGSLSTTNCI